MSKAEANYVHQFILLCIVFGIIFGSLFTLVWSLRDRVVPPVSFIIPANVSLDQVKLPTLTDFPFYYQIGVTLQFSYIPALGLTYIIYKIMQGDKGAEDEAK